MPIISDIGSLANFLLNLIRTLIQNPFYAVILLLMILFFPLNMLDFILFLVINFFIVIINVIFWIIIIPVNLLIGILDLLILYILSALFWPINLILELLGADPITPIIDPLPNISYFTIPYLAIDFFGDYDTIFGLLIINLGLSFPLFCVKYSNGLINLLKMKVY